MQFGPRPRGDDVGPRAAVDCTDVAGRLAEELVARPGEGAKVCEHVEHLLNRRTPALRVGRVRRAPLGRKAQAQRAFRAGGEAVVGRLAVDEVFAARGQRVPVRGARAEAARLLVNGEEQADLGEAFGAQALGGCDLRGDDALRVARAAPAYVRLVFFRRDEGRHRVHVGREHDARRRARGRQDVGSPRLDLLQFYFVAESFQVRREEAPDLLLLAGDGGDVNEAARQLEKVHKAAAGSR